MLIRWIGLNLFPSALIRKCFQVRKRFAQQISTVGVWIVHKLSATPFQKLNGTFHKTLKYMELTKTALMKLTLFLENACQN